MTQDFKMRLLLAILLSVGGLVGGLIWSGGQAPSWAAPGQHPHMQTIPTRPPEPTAEPPNPAPTNQPPAPPQEDDDDDGDVQITPTAPPQNRQPPEETSQPADEQEPTAAPTTPSNKAQDNQSRPQPPPDIENTENTQANLPQVDLFLSNRVNNPAPAVGQVVTFTIAVGNSGPNNATGAAVSAPLPAGLGFNLAAPTQGTYNPAQGVWTIGPVAASQHVTLTLAAIVENAGPITHTAQVTTVDQIDIDSTPGNGVEIEDDQASVTIAAEWESTKKSTLPDSAGQTNPTIHEPLPASVELPFAERFGSLAWLYALVLGIFLILSGLFLVRSA